jgi:hypothetical protein
MRRKMMKAHIHKLFVITLGVVLTFSALTFPARADQPFMKAARKSLNKAENSLKRATSDKGGHRARALDLVSRAINQINAGITYDRANPNDAPRHGVSAIFEEKALPVADQPRMHQAKNYLQDALNNLQQATPDKGGHRQNAIDLVRQAIDEVDKGIRFDRRN